MLHTASHFTPELWKGKVFSISRTAPKVTSSKPVLAMFSPSSGLLGKWKRGMSEEEYTAAFKAELKPKWGEIAEWLTSLNPKEDVTLLCWEKPGEFCHRRLVYALVAYFRPDCAGSLN